MLKSEKGLTLVEVLGSIAILSIIIITFMNVLGSSTMSTFRNDDRNEAMQIAEHELKKKLQSISNAAITPNIGTQSVPTYIVDSYDVTIYETKFPDEPIITTPTNNMVTLQAITILLNGANKEQRLLTITVNKRS